jgi:PAS domain S-box-containing protein
MALEKYYNNLKMNKKIFTLLLVLGKNIRNIIILFLFLVPIIVLPVYSYLQIRNVLTSTVKLHHQLIVSDVSLLVKERLDRVVDVGMSFATGVQLRTFIEEGNWDGVAKLLEIKSTYFPYIDNIIIFDSKGTLKAATNPTPEILGVYGKSFAYRDYYQGLIKTGKPYVSDVIKPAVPLGYNIVPITIPVESGTGTLSGLLLIILKLDTVTDWIRNVNSAGNSVIYIVDRAGNLAAHPTILLGKDVINLSSDPIVQKVLAGQTGIEEIKQPDGGGSRNMVAYQTIEKYGWGVVMNEPIANAFQDRNHILKKTLIVYIPLNLLAICLIVWFLKNRSKVQEAKAKDEAILKSIGDGMIAVDSNGNIIAMSEVTENMLGWKFKDINGKNLYDVISIYDQKGIIVPKEKRPMYMALTAGKSSTTTPHNDIYFYNRKDGSRFPVVIAVAPIIFKGKIIGAIDNFRDVTKEKEIDKAKSEFVSLASHQLRTPSTAVKWFTEMLLKGEVGKLNKKQKEYVEEIHHGNQRMIDLVMTLLNVSRLDLGTLAVAPLPTGIKSIVDDVLDELKVEIKKKDLQIEKSYEDIPPIETDPKLLRIVIQNLLSNSVTYTPEKKHITIKVKIVNPNIVIEISDEGCGIPKVAQAHIFSKFFRADNAHSIKPDGNGLGLYMSKAILESLGGEITFKSEENKGTTFFVSLPRQSNIKKTLGKELV